MLMMLSLVVELLQTPVKRDQFTKVGAIWQVLVKLLRVLSEEFYEGRTIRWA